MGHNERLITALEMQNALFSESKDHLIRVTVGQAQACVGNETLHLEALVPAYACLWRAYPPFLSDCSEWQIDIWMLNQQRKGGHSDVDSLALQALAATASPYRSIKISHDLESETPTRDFAFALWGAIDIARACRELEWAVRTHIPVLPEIAIEQFHRAPDDEITWMTGTLGGEGFSLYQHSGRFHKAILTVGEAERESRTYEVSVAEGWYGSQIFVNTLAKIACRMQDAGDFLLASAE